MARSLAATKHFHLARTLRQEFREMRPGEAVYTVEQLKQKFGVSQATVTRALERLQREGLIHRPAGKARYQIAEVVPRALHRVALIRPTWPSPDYDAITRALITIGREKGWAFDVYASQHDLEDLDLARAVGDADAGLLISPSDRMNERLLASLRRPRKPVVLVRDVPHDPALSGVELDNEQVGRLAVEHLAGRGHRRILCVVSEPPGRTMFDRAAGWRRAMRDLGADDASVEALLFESPVRRGQDSIGITYEAFRRWLRGPRTDFTAAFCCDWTGALAVMRALREEGLAVPLDKSVVAYAGESLLAPYLNPPLTAVETDMQELARAVVDLLERKLTDPSAEPRKVMVESHLVERGSVRALPGVAPAAGAYPTDAGGTRSQWGVVR